MPDADSILRHIAEGAERLGAVVEREGNRLLVTVRDRRFAVVRGVAPGEDVAQVWRDEQWFIARRQEEFRRANAPSKPQCYLTLVITEPVADELVLHRIEQNMFTCRKVVVRAYAMSPRAIVQSLPFLPFGITHHHEEAEPHVLPAGDRDILLNTGVTVIYGPNGSGKTTLMGRVTGQHVFILSDALHWMDDAMIPKWVSEDLAKSVYRRLGFHLPPEPVSLKPTLISLARNRAVAISWFIARAVQMGPRMVLIDDPFSGFHELVQYAMLDLLDHVAAAGVKVVVTTCSHDIYRIMLGRRWHGGLTGIRVLGSSLTGPLEVTIDRNDGAEAGGAE